MTEHNEHHTFKADEIASQEISDPAVLSKTPLVSVIMTTYNHEPYIAQAIEGSLMQETDFDYEILIGEDDSEDNTREICKRYAEEYPDKIRLFLNDRKNVIYINGQPTGRWNFINLLKNSKGKYIAFCEGDDYWIDPKKLQKQVDFLEKNHEYAICFHSVKIHKDDQILEDYITRNVPETTDIYELAKGNYIHTPSVVFRKKFLPEKYPAFFLKAPIGDYLIYLMLTENYHKIKKKNCYMACYRVHDGGVWSQVDNLAKIIKYLRLLIPYYDFDKNIFYPLYKRWIRLNISSIKRNIKNLNFYSCICTGSKLFVLIIFYYIKMHIRNCYLTKWEKNQK